MSGSSRWGSLFQGAVAGLESRLDTILGEDDQASARARAAEAEAKAGGRQNPAANKGAGGNNDHQTGLSRQSSRNHARPDRLQERLAKAVSKGSSAGSAPPTPDGRSSTDLPSRSAAASPSPSSLAGPGAVAPSTTESLPRVLLREASTASLPSKAAVDAGETDKHVDLGTERSEGEDFALSGVDSPRLGEKQPEGGLGQQLAEEQSHTKSGDLPELKTSSAEDENKGEMYDYLERIDALQSKLSYLTSQMLESATERKAAAEKGSADRKMAEKDEKIAQLLQEGEKLSKNEMKHLAIIKRLRLQSQENEKMSAARQKRLEELETEYKELKSVAAVADARESALADSALRMARMESQVNTLRMENEGFRRQITDLKVLLDEADQRADAKQNETLSTRLDLQMKAIADLNDELSNARIEKRLVEDRVKAELTTVKEEHRKQLDAVRLKEADFKAEIRSLEAKLEVFRSRAEDVSTTAGSDSQSNLFRQIETLQSQYSLASENWQGIENTLNSRVSALEAERDETARRESDVRKKARDANSKSRRLEDELESANEKIEQLSLGLDDLKHEHEKVQERLSLAQKEAQDAVKQIEQEKRSFESMLQSRIEEERTKWRQELTTYAPMMSTPTETQHGFRTESPTGNFNVRRGLQSDYFGSLHNSRKSSRVPSTAEMSALMPLSPDMARPQSRRTAALPHHFGQPPKIATEPPALHPPAAITTTAHDPLGLISGASHTAAGDSLPPTPSVHTVDAEDEPDDMHSRRSTPQRTIAEMISVSTTGAGPSVQLVERMSAAVRRLEAEKATTREEMERLRSQRDGARREVVELMREVEGGREREAEKETLSTELQALRGKLDAALEMLGEKSEECEELKNDVLDLKKIYRELVERTVK